MEQFMFLQELHDIKYGSIPSSCVYNIYVIVDVCG